MLHNVHLILAENTTFIKKKPNQPKKGVSVYKKMSIFNCIIRHLFQCSLKIVYRLASAWGLSTFLASGLCKKA